MNPGNLKRRSASLFTLLVLLSLSFLAGAGNGSGPVYAQEEPALAPDTGFWCDVSGVYTTTQVVGVTCSPGSGGVESFAYPSVTSADSRQANRFLTIANTALALGKNIWMFYNDSSAANPPDCPAANCRRIQSMLIQP